MPRGASGFSEQLLGESRTLSYSCTLKGSTLNPT